MDYFCPKCRKVFHGHTLARRRCYDCRGRMERLRSGVPIRRMASLRELVAHS